MKRTAPSSRRGEIWHLRVVLRETDPPVWRRVLVRRTTTLAQLHSILQDLMGWQDYHLWEFIVGSEHFEAPDPEASGGDATKVRLQDLRLGAGDTFSYVYDPGDDWEHEVTVEAQSPPSPDHSYPVCTGGARACPPEDSGGAHRFGELLKIMGNAKHPEHEEIMAWLGTEFHPDGFDIRTTNRVLMLAHQGGGAV